MKFRYELTAPSGQKWEFGLVDAEHQLDSAWTYRGQAGPGRQRGQFS